MLLRHLQFLTVLARERHFGRAAAALHVTQSTLSAAIRHLEAEIGAPVVERDRRFRGFTEEGERLLAFAQATIAAREALEQELAARRTGLAGHLRIGVIPAALPPLGRLTGPFVERHPGVQLTLLSRSSNEIRRALDAFEIDAGITYLDNEPLPHVRTVPLWTERYLLLTPADGPFAGRTSVTWAEAATVPLCLLTPDMQNRRIVDAVFASVGGAPLPRVETNAITGLVVHAQTGLVSSIVPQTFLHALGTPSGTLALPLTDPDRHERVGLAVPEREPLPPAVDALVALARSLRLEI